MTTARTMVVRTLVMLALVTVTTAGSCIGGTPGNNPQPVGDCQRASGTTLVGLAQTGSGSFTYNNTNTTDPLALCTTKHARVSVVKNTSSYNMSLAHGGAGAQFVVLNAGASTTAFSGQLVEGNWTAQFSGAAADLPSQMTITIEWTRP